MAQFSWAYVDCKTVSGNCKGPDGAVQVHHGGVNGNPTGSQAFVFTTSSVPYSLYVSGNMEIAAFDEDPSAPGANLTDGGVLYAKPDGNLYWRTSGEIVDLTMDTGSSGGPSGSLQFRKGTTNTFTGSAALVYDETPTVTTLYSTAVISASSTLHNVGAVTMGSTLATSGNIDTAGDMTAATITMTGFSVDSDGDTSAKSLKVDNGSTVGCSADTDMLTFNGNASPATLDVASNVVLKTGRISGSTDVNVVGSITSSANLAASGSLILAEDQYIGIPDKQQMVKLQDGSIILDGAAFILDAVSGSGILHVVGATTLGSTLSITGAVSGASTIHAVGAATFGSTLATSGNIDTAGDMTAATITMAGFSVDADGDTSAKTLYVDNGSTVGCAADRDMLTFNGNASPKNVVVASDVVLKTAIISGSSTISSVGSISSSGDLAVSGAVHASEYYGDGSNLSGISAGSTSGSARIYSATGVDTSGYLNVSGAAFLSGGLTLNHVMKNSNTYTITTADYYIGLDTTSNAITVTLPAVANCTAGKTYVIKDEGGNAGTNNITIEGDGSEKIDNQINQTINSNYASLSLYCAGARGWFIF